MMGRSLAAMLPQPFDHLRVAFHRPGQQRHALVVLGVNQSGIGCEERLDSSREMETIFIAAILPKTPHHRPAKTGKASAGRHRFRPLSLGGTASARNWLSACHQTSTGTVRPPGGSEVRCYSLVTAGHNHVTVSSRFHELTRRQRIARGRFMAETCCKMSVKCTRHFERFPSMQRHEQHCECRWSRERARRQRVRGPDPRLSAGCSIIGKTTTVLQEAVSYEALCINNDRGRGRTSNR